MPTVLALEPDARQAAALKLVVSGRVGADFVLAESKDAALSAIRSAVPDLILLTALISPRDESEIADLIRETDGAEHTQTLTIPLLDLGTSKPAKKKKRGLLSALTGEPESPGAPTGCDPAVFADEVANYLHQAEAAKAEAAVVRDRCARKPRRRKRDAVDELPPEPAPVGSSDYWAWDTPHGVPAAEPGPPALAASEETVVAQAPVVEPMGEATATGRSSWANPWDVSAPGHTYPDDHTIPGPDPFVAAGAETLAALIEPPAAASAADQLAAAPVHHADFVLARPDPVIAVEPREPSDALRAFEQPVALPEVEHDSEPDPRGQVESEIVRATLPTRAESGALLALQADVARLREQRASTDATLVAAKAAQERAAKAASDAAAHAKREAERRAEEAAARAREEARAERRARELAEKRAQAEAERRAEAEQRARQAAERLARQAAERAREEAAELARQQAAAERKAREQAERQAREETERRVQVERKARELAEQQAAAERKAREEAERRARQETARLEREARERQAHAEAERKAREAAEAHAAAERRAREQAEQHAREHADRLARDVERKALEEADRRAKKAEQAAHEQAAAMAREAEARAREEAAAERRAREQAERRAETERKAREQSERRAEADRLAREQAERDAEAARANARQPAARKAKPLRRAQKPTAPKQAKNDDGPRAVQDEWGLYDPQAAGFEALFARLESIENGETEIDEAPATPARGPRPLAMWAFQFEPVTDTPSPISRKGRDDFRALVSQFSIPHAVAAVSYASGARIRKVKIPAVSTRRARADADPRVVILSRKLLKAARRQAATDRLTSRR